MLNLNLLAPKEKENLAYAVKTRAVAALGAGFAVSLLISVGLLLPTIFLLFFQRGEALRRAELENESSERAGVTAELLGVNTANKLAGRVLEHEAKRRLTSETLKSLFGDVPLTLRLESLGFDPAAGKLDISGFAPTRAVMLEFLAALRQDQSFGHVSSPDSNIIRESNINFSVTITLP